MNTFTSEQCNRHKKISIQFTYRLYRKYIFLWICNFINNIKNDFYLKKFYKVTVGLAPSIFQKLQNKLTLQIH